MRGNAGLWHKITKSVQFIFPVKNNHFYGAYFLFRIELVHSMG